MRLSRLSLLAALVLSATACGSPPLTCGEGAEAVVLVGLTGLLDGEPAVEIIERVPESCDVLSRRWMFWHGASQELSVGPEPSEGVLTRSGVEVEPDGFFFTAAEVGFRVVYPAEVEASDVAFEWYTDAAELGVIDCRAADPLECSVRP